MERGVPRRRRPRPVASAAVEALFLRTDELAKGWLVALVEDAPLEEAASILAGEVARDGPRICDAVVRAIADDSDLRRLERDGVLEPLASRTAELAGARSVEAAAHAVETLREVVWSALRNELMQDDPDLLVEAAERLSLIADLVRGAVLRRRGDAEADRRRPASVAPLRVASSASAAGAPAAEAPAAGAPTATSAETSAETSASSRVAAGGVGRESGGAPLGDAVPVRASHGPREETAGEVLRCDALWMGALRDEIGRASRAQSPLSLLLVELEEAERLMAAEPGREASATFGRFAQAVRTSLRRRDVLACETDSRAWIIARDTGRAGAQALGARIAASVPAEESWRGAPLTVSVGLAVLGEDGHSAATLIDAAEQARFAAEASGIGIVDGGAAEEGPDPSGPGPSLAG
jgi:GGDEF domain-containing protein